MPHPAKQPNELNELFLKEKVVIGERSDLAGLGIVDPANVPDVNGGAAHHIL